MAWAAALDELNATVRDTFPAAATHAPTGAPSQDITCIHDYRWLELVASDGQAVSAQRHTAFVRLADLTTPPAQGDGLTIDGTGYEIIDVQADGGGGATLVLMVA